MKKKLFVFGFILVLFLSLACTAAAVPLCLPGMLGSPSLSYSGVTLIRGKTIRIARALLVTVGSEGSDRK